MQSYLKTLTGQSTVPNVFVGGNHLGGCDSTLAAGSNGKLKKFLENAKVSFSGL